MPALSTKDRRALAIGASALLIFVLVQFVFFPLLDSRKRLARGIRAKEKGLIEMRAMQKSYGQRSQQNNSLAEQVARRAPGFGLFSFLEKKAAEAKVKESIAYMKPSDPTGEGELQQAMVEMKLKSVTLRQLVAFLERIESPQNIVAIKRVSIQENKKEKGTLDVIMQVISLVPAGNNAG